MDAGVSPRLLSLTNSLLASVIAGAFGILVAPLITLNTDTLPLEIVPALVAGFTSLGVACLAGLVMGAAASLLTYWSSQTRFPQYQGNPLNGLPELLFFVLVAIAMFWRGPKVPARGELTGKRLPRAPRPENLARSSAIALASGVAALIVLRYDFRQALVNSMLGAMICLSLVVVVGYVGQISVVQVALARATGYAMSHMLTSVGGVWADFPLAPLVGVGLRPHRRFHHRDTVAGLRLRRARGADPAVPAGGHGQARQDRPADARRPVERAGGRPRRRASTCAGSSCAFLQFRPVVGSRCAASDRTDR